MGSLNANTIRVLLVDSESDDELRVAQLLGDSGSYAVSRVSCPDAAMAELTGDSVDVLISRYTLRSMTAADLLNTARRAGFDRPCIFISGGETCAADAAIAVGAHSLMHRNQLDREGLHVTVHGAHSSYQRTRRIERLAMRDESTGLLNRRGFLDALDKALQRHKRHKVGALGLIYADVDNLKLVNDAHGHSVGDFLLCTIGARIADCVRGTDSVGRVGGDEFAVVVEGLTDPSHIDQVVKKIELHISIPAAFGATILLPGLSIGTALYSDELSSADALMQAADEAMYAAKKARRRPNPLL